MPLIGTRGAASGRGFGLGLSGGLFPFSSHTFTNAGATGRFGPTLAQCQTQYSTTPWINNADFFTMSVQGYQVWTVPFTASYRIEAAGAIGGDGSSAADTPYTNTYGGAKMRGDVFLSAGTKLEIIVGQRGTRYRGSSSWSSGTGGGGSFVSIGTTGSTLLIAAGGGGGLPGDGGTSGAGASTYGQTTTAGGTTSVASGATNGYGFSQSTANYSTGGAGWLSDAAAAGNASSYGVMNPVGRANGFIGGPASTYTSAGGFWDDQGGFGGGGGAFASPAGGGGYSGGAPGGPSTSGVAGAGGGSYFDSSVVNRYTSNGSYDGSSSGINNIGSYNNGHGYVTITLL